MDFASLAEGTTLRFRTSGDRRGPWVVFTNSLGTDLTIWDDVAARLPAGYAILGYDKRGHGLSSLPSGQLTIDDHAGDLIALMDHVGIERATICGVSVGGMIAQRVAAREPDRVSSLILCDTGAKIGTAETWSQRISDIEAGGMEAASSAILERWFSAPFLARETAKVAGYRAMLARTPLTGYTATCAAIRDADLTEGTRALTAPTLCIAGANDIATPPSLMRELAGMISGATLVEIDQCGHIPSVEQPETTARVIREFLASLDQPRDAVPGAAARTRYDVGMTVRRRVLGNAHVDRASAASTPFDQPFQTFITEGAWGHLWSGRHLTLRERSIVTLALLAALSQDDEFAMHVRATANTGASPDDIREALMHVAVYAGVPKANHALKIAKAALAEISS